MPARIFKKSNRNDVYEYIYPLAKLRRTLILLAIGYVLWVTFRVTLYAFFGQDYLTHPAAPTIGSLTGFFWGAGIYAIMMFRKSTKIGTVSHSSRYEPHTGEIEQVPPRTVDNS